MTSEDPAGDTVSRMFGRVEKQLDVIGSKIDVHGERIAEHGVRLDRAEDDIRDIKTTAATVTATEQHHTITGRQVIAAAIVTVFGGGAVSLVIALVLHR